MARGGKGYLTILLMASAAMATTGVKQDADLEAGRRAYETSDYAKAIQALQAAAAKDPQSSTYHEWLGRAYGEKADHAGPFPAIGLARRAGREFEAAVQLDEKNFSGRQALIEFDCSAPG